MLRRTLKRILVFAVLVMLSGSRLVSLRAGEPAVFWDGLQAVFFSDNDGPFTLGFRFRADFDLRVTALGAFDYLGDGFATAHTVGIWSVNGGAPLVVATILSGTNAPLLGAFRYTPVTELPLSANTDYIVGASDFYGTNADLYPWKPQGFSTAPGVTFLHGRESTNEAVGLVFPQDEYDPGSPLAANFQFVVIPQLTIERLSSSSVGLTWTTNAAGYRLEYAEKLRLGVWNAVTNIPAVTGSKFVVSLMNTGGERYFRLSKP